MPEVSRLTSTATEDEGFAVETESAGTTYRYELRIVEERDREHDQLGTVELADRFEDGEPTSLEVTNAVRRAMNDQGYEVNA